MSEQSTPPGGRRAAPPRRRATGARRPRPGGGGVLAALMLAAAAALVALTPTAPLPPPAGAARGELVDRTMLSCPEPSEPVRSEVRVGLASGPGVLGEVGDGGSLTAGPLGGPRDDVGLTRGELAEVLPDLASTLDASGEHAVGVFAGRTDRERSRAAAVARCVSPRASWWFVGAGATLDHTSELSLANLDPGPAVVDVRLFAADGPVDTVGTRGITLAPGERTSIPMADIAPQNDELAVHVEATRGRVAASVLDRYASSAGADPGLEWLPAADRSARLVRLAGLPARASARTLLVGNPADLEAIVEVQVAGESGTFTPAGLEDVVVPPGTVESIDLAELPREPVALRLRSRVPVVAAARATRGADTSYAGTVEPLGGPAAVTMQLPGRMQLQLTAGQEPAQVRVTGYRDDGRTTGERVIDVDPTATATWRPPRRTSYAVVAPVEGRVHGAATHSGAGLTSVGLEMLPIRVDQPLVLPGP